MITGSVVLALAAAVLLVLGLLSGGDSQAYYYSSIVGSVLAGFALFAGLRHRPDAQLPEDDFDGPVPSDRDRAAVPEPEPPAPERPGRASVATSPGDPHPPEAWEEGVAVATAAWPDTDAEAVPDGLPDEPGEQELTAYVASRVAELRADVVVIDGRPRYHLAQCLHLLGRATDHLPVNEAVELGFTPCADCEPATAVLASSQH